MSGVNRIENPRLLRAMEAVALHDTSENRASLYSSLLDAFLIIPTPDLRLSQTTPGLHIADGSTSYKIITLKRADGQEATPVFTDELAMRNWDSRSPWIGMRGRDFFPLILAFPIAEVVINPFDPNRKMIRAGGTLRRWEFEELAKGRTPNNAGLVRKPS